LEIRLEVGSPLALVMNGTTTTDTGKF